MRRLLNLMAGVVLRPVETRQVPRYFPDTRIGDKRSCADQEVNTYATKEQWRGRLLRIKKPITQHSLKL
jgi:hypothetical protein